jgi:hypothetical protein
MGELHRAPTFDLLVRKVKRTYYKYKSNVEIPFVQAVQGVIRKGVARGINPMTNAVLVTWEDGTKGDLNEYASNIFEPVPEEILIEYVRLCELEYEASVKLQKYMHGNMPQMALHEKINHKVEKEIRIQEKEDRSRTYEMPQM